MLNKIVAMSCMQALQYVVYNRSRVNKFAIISIQEIENGGNGFVFTESGCCKKVLTLYFSDANPEVFEECGNEDYLKQMIKDGTCHLFGDKEANSIKDFVEEIKNDSEISTLIVHCGAGVSRSPAIAAAIHNYLFGNNGTFFEEQIPNKFVYRKLLECLKNN